ncbi:MAG: PAS domain S-box protein, partial [Lachnospiraceae bacterium]|nr:PAS domain S-box protein [Lachnospiraceae bacterium]
MENENRKTEAASQERELAKAHFLKNIRQMKNNAVLLKKEDGFFKTVYVSDDFADMMECTIEKAMEIMNGAGFVQTTHPDDRLTVKRMLRRRISQDGRTDLTIRKVTALGSTIWCNVHYAFIDDFDEHYVYCTYFNVTVQKEYEERLRSAYMNLGDSFYQINDRALGMFRVNLTRDRIEDMQGKDLYGTDSMVRPYSEVVRLRADNYPIQSEKERFLEIFDSEKLIAGYLDGKAQLSQYLFSRRRDGTLCFVNYTAVLTRHPMTGDVVAFITELECNKEKVNETLLNKILSRQFDMVTYLANGRYGVVIGDASMIEKGSIFPLEKNGNYVEWLENQVIPQLHGTEDECAKMRKALEPETIVEEVNARNPYVVNIQIDIDGEIYHKRFDFYSIDPQARFYVLLKSDTTEVQREQMERNNQLRDALKEAEQANVAKTTFLSRMSHEIRTPMNAIIGLDNIALQEKDMSDSLRDHLEKIGSSARYLLTLINDILDMSRIESGRMTLKYEEFSFKSFLEQVNTMVDGQCRDRGLHYDCVIHGTVSEHYIGDDTKLKQVLINILGNAVKFTEPGGKVSLDVEQTAQYEDQCTMRFVIKDTGIGMDKEYIPKIFEA